jgi:hypothetical protein
MLNLHSSARTAASRPHDKTFWNWVIFSVMLMAYLECAIAAHRAVKKLSYKLAGPE